MHPIDDLDLDALLLEAGWDWQYSAAQSNRNIDKPYPQGQSAEPRGEGIFGVSKEIWDAMSPQEQALQQSKFERRQAALTSYKKRLSGAVDSYMAGQAKPAQPKVSDIPTDDTASPERGVPVATATRTSGGKKYTYNVDGFGELLGEPIDVQDAPAGDPDPYASDDWHDWPKTEPKPEVKPNKLPERPLDGRFRRGSEGATIKDTPGGLARELQAETSTQTGFIVVHDQHKEIPLAGPYPTEDEARADMNRVAAEMAAEQIQDMADLGHQLTPDQQARVKEMVAQQISFRYYDPVREDKLRQTTPDGKKTRFDYGQMREKLVAMHEAGEIQNIKDENPDSEYLKGKPTLDNLKKVWSPLLLDLGNPPRQPWTFEQILHAMMPVINSFTYKWKGSGFSESDVFGVAVVSLLKAIMNDRGMSPFSAYARWWMRGDIRRAKKKAGVMPRALKDSGWGNQGATSMSAPLTGGDGAADGELGSTVGSESPGFNKVTCPDCGGTKKSANDTPESCQYCTGEGKNTDGTPCGLCKGQGWIMPPCSSCGGTGRIVIVTKNDQLRSRGLEIYKDESGNYQIRGDIDELEKQELLERLNKAGRLVSKIMDVAGLNQAQQDLINLRFGLKTGVEYGTTDIARMIKARCTQCNRLNLDKLDAEDELTSQECSSCGGKLYGLGTKQGVETKTKQILNKMRKVIVGIANTKTGPKSPKVSKELLDLFDWFTEYQKEYGLMDLTDTENRDGWIDRPVDPADEELLASQARKDAASKARKRAYTPEEMEKFKAIAAKGKATKAAAAAKETANNEYIRSLLARRDAMAVDEGINLVTTVLLEYIKMMEAAHHKILVEEVERGELEPEILLESL